jgi:hypothetical protein
MTPPYWFKLLRYQRARGKTGLTIPFLIGAARASVARPEMDEEHAYAELAGVLGSFRDRLPNSHSVVIKECDELHVPIAALYAREHGRPNCESVEDHMHKATPLYMERAYLTGRRPTIDSAIKGLWNEFGVNLMAGQFSFRNEKYVSFNGEDFEFIKKAYAYKEPDHSSWKRATGMRSEDE